MPAVPFCQKNTNIRVANGGCQSGVSETVETYISRRGISIKTMRKASTYGWFKKSTILVWSDNGLKWQLFVRFCWYALVETSSKTYFLTYMFLSTKYLEPYLYNTLNMFYTRDTKNPLILTSICFPNFSKRNLQLPNPKGKPDVIPHVSRLRSLHAW